jgi:hypothetical protein
MPWWRPARSTLQPGDCGSLELIDDGRLAIHQTHRVGTVDALIALHQGQRPVMSAPADQAGIDHHC